MPWTGTDREKAQKIKYNKSPKGLLAQARYRRGGKRAAACARYYRNNEASIRGRHLQRLYGMTILDFLDRLANQKFRCLICGDRLAVFGKETAVDHCHETGKIRGILCALCNRGLGNFQDNQNLLLKAIEYINDEEIL